MTAADWDGVGQQLGQARIVYAVDLRGHGASDWPGQYSIELMADDVVRLVDGLGTPVDLVGHSLGGLVACLVAEQRPRLVRRLVLEDVGMPHARPPATPPRPEGELDFDWAVVEQVRPQIDSPDEAWPERFRHLAVTTLVIAGGEASFVPQRHIRELVDTLPDARVVTVPVGHEVHAQDPVEFLAHLVDFLAS